MKIYDSSIFVDEPEYFQLSVICVWDFITKPVCYKYCKNLGGQNLISYCLYKKQETSNGIWHAEPINTLTNDMKNELISMGYTIKD